MALELKDIHELVQLVEKAEVAEFHMEHEGTKITIKKAVGEVAVQPVAPVVQLPPPTAQNSTVTTQSPAPTQETKEVEDAGLHKIESPMVGTFYRSPSPDADPYVQEGNTVSVDSVVCIVEAMKLMNEIEAEVNGTIEKILVKNGELVEFGQPLFLVRTT
ncbi:biotin carboxyl carrier protein [Seinonella peptonophila]|uniref:Biotin carboxyl carrier protein of acetyl-CoA carboxylase n=1 Tax=Seinonella peptonophila TaxID=112248 RepID=A0A1M4TN19_9BACL|nr:acetyl-CoA carboxylase biotin carboxyl carrier protein [Seinonella peptonophila]SHE45677.1 biotin carboxyl carrier protein [Seinonella peptonophila]